MAIYLLLMRHLVFYILDNVYFKVFNSGQFETLHLTLNFRRNVVELLLTALNLSLPLQNSKNDSLGKS